MQSYTIGCITYGRELLSINTFRIEVAKDSLRLSDVQWNVRLITTKITPRWQPHVSHCGPHFFTHTNVGGKCYGLTLSSAHTLFHVRLVVHICLKPCSCCYVAHRTYSRSGRALTATCPGFWRKLGDFCEAGTWLWNGNSIRRGLHDANVKVCLTQQGPLPDFLFS